MKKNDSKSFLLLPALLLALTGCGSSSDTESEDTGNSGEETAACSTSEGNAVANTYLPEITYTEVDEGSAANDSKGSAKPVVSNSIVSGTFAYGSDYDDYYVLTVTDGDKFEIELSTPNAGTNALLQLFSDSEFTGTQDDSGNSVKRVSYTVPADMTELYILVTAYDGSGPYSLKITTPAEPVAIESTPAAECLANLEGSLSNAVNGAVVADATINLREGTGVKTGTVDFTATGDAQGNYEFTDVDAGEYTVEIIKEGYITHYLDIELVGEKTTEKKFQLSPSLTDGQLMRVVMSWGASPSILDSYLNGPKSTSGMFDVRYYKRTGDGASLDRDATSGYGPETITFSTFNEGTYTYWINDYSNGSEGSNTSSTKLGESGANVTVYDSTGIIKQYKVPSGAGTKWNVFTITVDGSGNKTINDVNTLGVWSESP